MNIIDPLPVSIAKYNRAYLFVSCLVAYNNAYNVI